ncbi:MAG TPA: N-glycosylase, partial [Eubacteriaceae bacterium]|nr:N-glycosylase [Eubacteriaceae bacterium]
MLQEYYRDANDVVARIDCFDLRKTLECGQCFRWN